MSDETVADNAASGQGLNYETEACASASDDPKVNIIRSKVHAVSYRTVVNAPAPDPETGTMMQTTSHFTTYQDESGDLFEVRNDISRQILVTRNLGTTGGKGDCDDEDGRWGEPSGDWEDYLHAIEHKVDDFCREQVNLNLEPYELNVLCDQYRNQLIGRDEKTMKPSSEALLRETSEVPFKATGYDLNPELMERLQKAQEDEAAMGPPYRQWSVTGAKVPLNAPAKADPGAGSASTEADLDPELKELLWESQKIVNNYKKTQKPSWFKRAQARVRAFFKSPRPARPVRFPSFSRPHTLSHEADPDGVEISCCDCKWYAYYGDASKLPSAVNLTFSTRFRFWFRIRLLVHTLYHLLG